MGKLAKRLTNRLGKIAGYVITGMMIISIIIILFAVFGVIFQFAWNLSIPLIFSLPEITVKQAVGILILLWFLKQPLQITKTK